MCLLFLFFFFFFNDTATTEIYTLSLHDALPICGRWMSWRSMAIQKKIRVMIADRKSTRLNSSHQLISYAVFCLKKKKKKHSLEYLYEKHSPQQKQDTQGYK